MFLIAIVPAYFAFKVGGGPFTWIFFAIFTSIPILAAFWAVASTISPRKNEKARFPGRPIEHYLQFKNEKNRDKYHGKSKIPMETFHELYFDGEVDFKGDALEVMEYRHDWASFRFTISLFRFFLTGMMPEVIMHTRSQGTLVNPSFMDRSTKRQQTRSKSATITIAEMTSMAGSWAPV